MTSREHSLFSSLVLLPALWLSLSRCLSQSQPLASLSRGVTRLSAPLSVATCLTLSRQPWVMKNTTPLTPLSLRNWPPRREEKNQTTSTITASLSLSTVDPREVKKNSEPSLSQLSTLEKVRKTKTLKAPSLGSRLLDRVTKLQKLKFCLILARLSWEEKNKKVI